MRKDSIEFEILPDGRIKWTTDKISPQNHTNADRFLAEVGRLHGGEETIERRQGHSHSHQRYGHSHTH